MFATSFPKDCESDYQRNGKVVVKCTHVASESYHDLKSASPNGTFVFELSYKENLNMTLLHSFKISIGGTLIRFNESWF